MHAACYIASSRMSSATNKGPRTGSSFLDVRASGHDLAVLSVELGQALHVAAPVANHEPPVRRLDLLHQRRCSGYGRIRQTGVKVRI